MNRRQLLCAMAAASLSGCTTEVEIRQPTPTVERVNQYGSDKNLKVTVQTARFERSQCRFRVAGRLTEIQWPTGQVTLYLFLFNEKGNVITSGERPFSRVAPGDVIEFDMAVSVADCERPAGYEVVGRRTNR